MSNYKSKSIIYYSQLKMYMEYLNYKFLNIVIVKILLIENNTI